jgi:membrane protease subunit HflK
MAWDDDKSNDPWRPRGNQGPADLDAIVRDLQRKLSGLFGGKGRGGDDGKGERGPGPGPKIGSGLIAFALVIGLGLWAATGFYIVDEAERGVVLRFGKYTNITMPGLRWHLPTPIENVVTINTNEVVAWPYQGSMLTRDENIIDINLEVQYVRRNPEAYLFSMVDPEATLQDVTASAIREIVGKNDLAYILTAGRLEIANQALELIQSTLDSYGTGIDVILMPMDEAQYPEEVQASVQDVVKAREDRERAVADAYTYRNQIIPRARGQAVRQIQNAEGYRSRIVADAEGESRRFSQILTEYQNAPAVTRERIYLETLEAILANSTKILVDTEGGNNLLYLPLDQLIQRRETESANASVTTSSSLGPVESPAPVRTPATQSGSR